MSWLRVKKVFRNFIISAFVDVRLKWLCFGAWKLAWNYFKITAEANCISWIFVEMFNVAEITMK